MTLTLGVGVQRVERVDESATAEALKMMQLQRSAAVGTPVEVGVVVRAVAWREPVVDRRAV